ncbi:MAG: hypothetical protein IPP07_29040 [Holophagales bacterium]|nr:hypothetical protein [Holophagales bacterium]
MKRLLAALLLVASPALAQSNGWQEIQNGWGEIQTPPSALPATAGNDGKVLTVSTGGTATEWAAAPAPGAAGSDTQVNFNDGGVLAGNAGFTFAKASKALGLTGPLTLTPGADIVPATFRAFSSGTNHIQQNQDSSNNILSGWTHAGEPFLLAGKGAGKVLTSDANGVGTWAAAGGGITNSAGANVLAKSDGTNLVASVATETAATGTITFPKLAANSVVITGLPPRAPSRSRRRARAEPLRGPTASWRRRRTERPPATARPRRQGTRRCRPSTSTA